MALRTTLGVCFPFLRPLQDALRKAHSRLTCIRPETFEFPEFEWDWEDYQVKYQPISSTYGDVVDDEETQILFQRSRLRLRNITNNV